MPEAEFPEAQALRPPNPNNMEIALAMLLDGIAESNEIRLPSFSHLSEGGRFLDPKEAMLGRSALEVLQQALNRSSASIISKLSLRLNSEAPIHRLPLEILTEILRLSLEPNNQYVHSLHRLALVCRGWWTLVKASTELWTTARTDQTADEIELVLRKSKGRMLRVIVEGSGYRGLTIMPPIRNRWQPPIGSLGGLQSVKTEISRWERFEFVGTRLQAWMIQDLPGGSCLRDIDIRITLGKGEIRPILPPYFYQQTLSHVRLVGVSFDWAVLLGIDMISLDVDNPVAFPSPDKLCELLSLSQRLTQLRLSESVNYGVDKGDRDSPLNWTSPKVHMPLLKSLELTNMPPQYLVLLGRIDAPKCATVTLGGATALVEPDLVEQHPPLLTVAITSLFRPSRRIDIQVTRRRGLSISISRQERHPPFQLELKTSQPSKVLDFVGGLLRSHRFGAPVTLYFEEQIGLPITTMQLFPTLRQINVVGSEMCEDLMRCLMHASVEADGEQDALCPDLDRVRMTYVWGEIVPPSHCTLLHELVQRRWSGEGHKSRLSPIFPAEFTIFPPGPVSGEFQRAVKQAASMVPTIRLVENEERFFLAPMDQDVEA